MVVVCVVVTFFVIAKVVTIVGEIKVYALSCYTQIEVTLNCTLGQIEVLLAKLS